MIFSQQAGAGTGRSRGSGPSKLTIVVSSLVAIATLGGFAALAVLGASLLGRLPADEAPTSSAKVRVSGFKQVVFDYSREACSKWNVPDTPARAFRDSKGRVQLILGSFDNYRMVGRTLGRLEVECDPVMRSASNPNPAKFEDREWITSLFTRDGKKVHALLHNEFQGYRHPGRCATGDYVTCWYNAVTQAVSNDGGASFSHRAGPRHLVAAVPYRYKPDSGPVGLFEPSNIVFNPEDDKYYSLVRAERHRSQRVGTCLMRTPNLADPDAWRAWDGEDFSVRFDDPYHGPVTSAGRHVCAPVAFNEIQSMTSSLTFNTYFDQWLLVGLSGVFDASRNEVIHGIYYSLSDDLLHWSKRKLLREKELLWTHRCGDPDPILYPSLIDPGSPSRSFDVSGRRPYLYYTQFHYADCKPGPNRDLMRVRVEFDK